MIRFQAFYVKKIFNLFRNKWFTILQTFCFFYILFFKLQKYNQTTYFSHQTELKKKATFLNIMVSKKNFKWSKSHK